MRLIKTVRTNSGVSYFVEGELSRKFIIVNNKVGGCSLFELKEYMTLPSETVLLTKVTDCNIHMTYKQLFARLIQQVNSKRDYRVG